MAALSIDFLPDGRRNRPHRNKYGHSSRNGHEDGFICKHCHAYVSTASFLSGVQNRNHCPYCLWSRHVDLHAAGDRLSACKSPMKPVALTVKATGKKYGVARGELMLIHLCTECEGLSINRIAADDIPETVYRIFEVGSELDAGLENRLKTEGIHVLQPADQETVRAQLFGSVVQKNII